MQGLKRLNAWPTKEEGLPTGKRVWSIEIYTRIWSRVYETVSTLQFTVKS
jgi:hypothetical protein